MATLGDLLKMDGVAAACEFTADGKPVKFKANMEMASEIGATMAQFCATVTKNFNTLAGSFTKLSGKNWVPQQGWMYAGVDWTVCIGGGGYRGVFVQTAKADASSCSRPWSAREGEGWPSPVWGARGDSVRYAVKVRTNLAPSRGDWLTA